MGNGELDTGTLWKGDLGLGLATFANDENVLQPSGEFGARLILDVDNVEHTWVSVTGSEDSDTAGILTASDVYLAADFELDQTSWPVGGKVNLDRIEHLGVWVWVSHGLAIVGDNVWDAARAGLGLHDLSELELCFLVRHLHWDVSALCVVEKTEVLVRLWDGNNVCGIGRETC